MILDFGFWILDFVNSEILFLKSKTKNQRPKTKIFIILIFVVFGLFACSESKRSRDGIVIADSKSYAASIYRQNCAVCHGSEAYGKTLDGKLVPSLRFGNVEKKSRAEIYQQIKHGKLPMPAFENQLTESEINQMVDFVMYDLQARERKKETAK